MFFQMTLFQISTLSSWTNIAYTEWHGCDTFSQSMYHEADKPSVIHTLTGAEFGWACSKPSKQPVFTFFYFTTFTIVTAMVIMSLFIGVITMVSHKTITKT
jgi:hypothetical protein